MSIQEHLNKIRNAIKGSEVRESIAKGIETAYDDASEKDNANMEVKMARGTNPNLNARLNKMDETDRQNTEKIDSDYNEVTAQLAQIDGKKLDKNRGAVTSADLSQEVKEQMTGESVAVVGENSVLENNIVDGQVTRRKLSNNLGKKVDVIEDTANYAFAIVDDDENAVLIIDNNGNVVFNGLDEMATKKDLEDLTDIINTLPSNLIVKSKPFETKTELSMFIAYGQSWSLGYDSDALSTTQKYSNLMFNTGVKKNPIEDFETTATDFVPLIESTTNALFTGGQKLGETVVASQTDMVIQLLKEENIFDHETMNYKFLGTAPGMGSSTMAQLSKGTQPYERMIEEVRTAFNIAKTKGVVLKVEAFSWAQSSGASSHSDYAQDLENLRLDIENDIKSITGQTEPVRCITTQIFPTGDNQSKRQYENYVGASERFDHIICSGTTYQLETMSTSNLHFTGEHQQLLGAQFGQAFKRTINDGVKFEPLKPIGAYRQGNVILLEFNTANKIVLDVEELDMAENYGFEVFSADGSKKTITDVSVNSNNTLKIRLASDFASSDRIVYGNTGSGWGRPDGKRGNVRDSSHIHYKSESASIPLYNWLVVFDKTVSDLEVI